MSLIESEQRSLPDRRRVSRGGRRAFDRAGAYPPVLVADSYDGVRTSCSRYLDRFNFQVLQATTDAARQAGEGCTADEKLRRFVHVHLRRMLGERDDWIPRLINREVADPTPALDTLVEQGLRPRLEYLAGIVAEILACPTSDPRVMRSVVSVQAQSVAYLPSAIGVRLGQKTRLTPAEIDDIARHVSEFSLAGIRALA